MGQSNSGMLITHYKNELIQCGFSLFSCRIKRKYARLLASDLIVGIQHSTFYKRSSSLKGTCRWRQSRTNSKSNKCLLITMYWKWVKPSKLILHIIKLDLLNYAVKRQFRIRIRIRSNWPKSNWLSHLLNIANLGKMG